MKYAMLKGTYRGPHITLTGKTAMVRLTRDDNIVEAQFDDLSLGHWAYGWHIINIHHFDIEVTYVEFS